MSGFRERDYPDLQTYDPDRLCPKCKNAEVRTRYTEGHQCPKGCLAQMPEHFVRTCQRCFYSWPEVVAEGSHDDADS